VEKRKPSHSLAAFKEVAGDPDRLQMTETAAASAQGLGFKRRDVSALIQTVERRMFYKSMTSLVDNRKWQDVYHVPTDKGLTIYLKFTSDVVTQFLVLSFKEK
jgi:motility quorum-sensing regulator/GCU-specific mRNA interferase toxin